MKEKLPWIIVLVMVVICGYLYFRKPVIPSINLSIYKHQIDSLQYNIDSLKKCNDSIYTDILELNAEREYYNDQIINLQKQLKNEKKKTQSLVDAVDTWSDNDVQWFFANRYKGFINDSTTNTNSKTSNKGSN